MQACLIVATTAFLAALVATPLSAVLARRLGAMDQPEPRKIHTRPVPRWGGVAIAAGLAAGAAAAWAFIPSVSELLSFSATLTRAGSRIFTLHLGEQMAGIAFGTGLLVAVGMADDRVPMRPGMKLLFQIIAAMAAMIYGVRIHGFAIPGWEAYSQFPMWLTMITTVLWLVAMTNAVNLVDGLDGLAAGVVAIVAGAFVAVALVQAAPASALVTEQMRLAGLIASALLGASLGFLVFNFHPARVFLGDGGSLGMGFLLGCVAVIGTFKTTTLAVLLIPFLLVAVPFTDMAMAFGRRLLRRRNPFQADRGHLHHRLLDAGWTQREVVLLIYVVTLAMALISITLAGLKKG